MLPGAVLEDQNVRRVRASPLAHGVRAVVRHLAGGAARAWHEPRLLLRHHGDLLHIAPLKHALELWQPHELRRARSGLAPPLKRPICASVSAQFWKTPRVHPLRTA